MRRRRFLQIAAAALAVPCTASAETRWEGVALGADVSVTLRGEPRAAERALDGIAALLARMEREFSLFDPSSALCRLNTEGVLGPSPDFLALCVTAASVHAATGGLFDPTVQPLWRALAEGRDPTAARAAIGWGRVGVSAGAITLQPGQALTFNGIAQGYATDRVRDLLAAEGFTEALVNIGEFAALGGPFRIGLADPSAGLLGWRHLASGAMATSSPAAMSVGGGSHILAPDGRAPLWSTVTVEADSAALADGLSTAFCLMDRAVIRKAADALPGVRGVTLVGPSGDLQTI
ncbi:MAG: FAD:protein FMN transferase [Rhodobacteraceae bacterium]|nr:FAD:protein FMN transferase [Paracoccaceae bacterium]